MAILLIGLLGVVTMFSVGMNARMLAQETIVSQQLANMWASWIRYRLDDAGAGANVLRRSQLQPGARGHFYEDTGTFHGAPGSSVNLPTYQCNAFRGYEWEIVRVDPNYKPQWLPESSAAPIAWDRRLDGGALLPGGMSAPAVLSNVELAIFRGVRRYRFNYVFSGIGMKYGKL